MGGVGGWLDTDNKTFEVKSNLTGTGTGTELSNYYPLGDKEIWCMN